jgi:hypothetical protein
VDGTIIALADKARLEQFALLGRTRRLFRGWAPGEDGDGVSWATQSLGPHQFAVTWLGPGWVFDAYAGRQWAQDLADRRQAMRQADEGRRRQELAGAVARLRLGPRAERVLWAVYRAVLAGRRSVVRIPDVTLGRAVWGEAQAAWPTHWRTELSSLLGGLAWLHVADQAGDGDVFGSRTALLTHARDLRVDAEADACGEDCPGHGGPSHHHFLVNIGRGFLGVLERFASEDSDSGVRTYDFPVAGPKGAGPTLRAVGRTGRLVPVYLPARLGEPSVCASFTGRQLQLLQAVVREKVRPALPGRRRRRAAPRRAYLTEEGVLEGNCIPDRAGKTLLPCPLLDPEGRFEVFGGNGKRPGLGYRLLTPGRWMAKAGYGPDEVDDFLADLAGLKGRLGLTVVGIGRPNDEFIDLDKMRQLSATAAGSVALGRLHVRVFAKERCQ